MKQLDLLRRLRQFAEGFAAESMTRILRGAVAGTSLRPSCCWRALKMDGAAASGESIGPLSGAQRSSKSERMAIPVLSMTVRAAA